MLDHATRKCSFSNSATVTTSNGVVVHIYGHWLRVGVASGVIFANLQFSTCYKTKIGELIAAVEKHRKGNFSKLELLGLERELSEWLDIGPRKINKTSESVQTNLSRPSYKKREALNYLKRSFRGGVTGLQNVYNQLGLKPILTNDNEDNRHGPDLNRLDGELEDDLIMLHLDSECENLVETMKKCSRKAHQVQYQAPDIRPDMPLEEGPGSTSPVHVR
ncbi:hypothetical protein FNV43_RR04402 [Rhamnella rubrinervis]|uniref:Uncharacterized protein n=1 Tax=Rhamnella rubrinervis TaxID=2594499 RepID=A0A8K0HLP6_9ROSA|nr:hypothetical protein FNV43_RR04402 [Rhamnella rubrinervis]